METLTPPLRRLPSPRRGEGVGGRVSCSRIAVVISLLAEPLERVAQIGGQALARDGVEPELDGLLFAIDRVRVEQHGAEPLILFEKIARAEEAAPREEWVVLVLGAG